MSVSEQAGADRSRRLSLCLVRCLRVSRRPNLDPIRPRMPNMFSEGAARPKCPAEDTRPYFFARLSLSEGDVLAEMARTRYPTESAKSLLHRLRNSGKCLGSGEHRKSNKQRRSFQCSQWFIYFVQFRGIDWDSVFWKRCIARAFKRRPQIFEASQFSEE